jgi:hypothetical protein
MITLSDVQISGDTIRARARQRAALPVPTPAAGGSTP